MKGDFVSSAKGNMGRPRTLPKTGHVGPRQVVSERKLCTKTPRKPLVVLGEGLIESVGIVTAQVSTP